jgi:hydrogenase maturation protein HypF
MELEFVLEGVETDETYQFQISNLKSEISNLKSEIPNPKSAYVVDWLPMIEGILEDVRSKVPVGEISAKFHNTLVEMIVAVARRVGQERIVLSGGCFQNKYLTERAVTRLKIEGFRPYWHQRIPPNDGGIALGQVLAASKGCHISSL